MSFWRKIKKITAFTVVGSITFTLPVTIIDVIGYPASVYGESMQPALNPKGQKRRDRVFLNKWKAKDFQFQRGEIVSLLCPTDALEAPHIKRIVALEGDTVETKGYNNRYVRVPQGHCWMEGDNQSVSFDSNMYGPLPLGMIQSKATQIIWPPSRWQKLEPIADNERVNPINMPKMNNKEDIDISENSESVDYVS